MSQESILKNKGFLKFESDPLKSTLDVARGLGGIFEAETISRVQTLVPKMKADELDNTYSGNFGLEAFPFHTDLAHWYIPPRYIFLRCLNPAKNIATKLIDRQSILDEQVYDLVNRAHFRSRKRLDRKTSLLKIMHDSLFRWDSLYIVPVNKAGAELKTIVNERIDTAKVEDVFLSKPGDCVLIDNWRMLHGRGSINKDSMHRKIQRVYFNEVTF